MEKDAPGKAFVAIASSRMWRALANLVVEVCCESTLLGL
jgi:hypothetical protein